MSFEELLYLANNLDYYARFSDDPRPYQFFLNEKRLIEEELVKLTDQEITDKLLPQVKKKDEFVEEFLRERMSKLWAEYQANKYF